MAATKSNNNKVDPSSDTVKSLMQKAFKNQESFVMLQEADLIDAHEKYLTDKYIDEVCKIPFDLSFVEDSVNNAGDKNDVVKKNDENNVKADSDNNDDHGGEKESDHTQDDSAKVEHKDCSKTANVLTCSITVSESVLPPCEYFVKPASRLHWLLDSDYDSFDYSDFSATAL